MLFVNGGTNRLSIGTAGASPDTTVHMRDDTPTLRIQRDDNANNSTIEWAGAAGVRANMFHLGGDNDLIISEIYERDSTEGETFELPMDQILDLRPMLQEQILLTLPLTPLCSDNCQGPIPEEYPARSESQQEGNHNLDPPIDPRWEALGSLTFEEEEVN